MRWATSLLIAVALLTGVFSAGSARPVTTYTVVFHETGLPASTSWTVNFNSVPGSSTTSTISFSSVSAGANLYFTVTTPVAGTSGVQYVATNYNGYVTVPGQLNVWIVFQQQFQLSFLSSPVGAGTTTPGSTTWFNAGTQFVASASPGVGNFFTSWTASPPSSMTIKVATDASTMITPTAPGTLTANFGQTLYNVTFTEVGLPSGTLWSVIFNGASTGAMAPSSIVISSVAAYSSYYWTCAAVSSGGAGTEYAPAPNAGGTSGYLNVPIQTLQTVVFSKEYQVQFQVSPSGTGSTYPSSSGYYTAGTVLPIAASASSGYVFSSWGSNSGSLVLASTSAASTTATVNGPGILTANFVSGTPCSVCTVTFQEVGLPSGTVWAVTFNNTVYGSSTTTITIANQGTGSYYWTPQSPIGAGSLTVAYLAQPTGTSMYVPYQTLQVVVFTKEVWVQFQDSPSSSSGSTTPSSGAWYAPGSVISISGVANTYWLFVHWRANSTHVTFASATAVSTTVSIAAPVTITASFAQLAHVVTFIAYRLPAGTTWGVTINSVTYLSNKGILNIANVTYGGWSWSAVGYYSPLTGGGNGVQYVPTQPYGSIYVPTQILQSLVFVQQFWVNYVGTPGGHGTVNPSGAGWYPYGTVLAIAATNGSGTFTGWSSTTASITLASVSSASTLATIKGTGTVTGTFT